MFDKLETLDEARALVRSLSTEQLAEMTMHLTIAWLSGEASDEVCTAVALLIEESAIERIDAEMQKDIVTVH
jgi:hypothetical protein